MIEMASEGPFISTKPHRRFVEFVESCRRDRYIGVCYGRPGVGKTFSAKVFAHWDVMDGYTIRDEFDEAHRRRYAACQAVFYTATVANTPKTVTQGLYRRIFELGHVRGRLSGAQDEVALVSQAYYYCPLVIVDEADRLVLKSFEQLRDLYDKFGFGLVLLAMPGIEKRLARYPQFYSRIGFVHEFLPLSPEEMHFIFEKHWKQLGFEFDAETFNDVEAMNAAIRITQGNFRLIRRLFSQIQRILEINKVDRITTDVVEAARDCLVIGKP
jgi:type II secretory pathway predicted ATPase ExeA